MFKTSSKITSGLAVMLATGALAGPASASMLDGTSPAPNDQQIAALQGHKSSQSGPNLQNLPQGSGGFLAKRSDSNGSSTFVAKVPDDQAVRGLPAVRIEQAKTVASSNSSDIDTTSAGLGLAVLALLGGTVVIARRQTRGRLAS